MKPTLIVKKGTELRIGRLASRAELFTQFSKEYTPVYMSPFFVASETRADIIRMPKKAPFYGNLPSRQVSLHYRHTSERIINHIHSTLTGIVEDAQAKCTEFKFDAFELTFNGIPTYQPGWDDFLDQPYKLKIHTTFDGFKWQ